jgi:hypothetical protein
MVEPISKLKNYSPKDISYCKSQDIESDIPIDFAIYSWRRQYAEAVPSSINDFEIGSSLQEVTICHGK